jgi:1-acyl-sn-glycerol-3-phosphate acyltransferase
MGEESVLHRVEDHLPGPVGAALEMTAATAADVASVATGSGADDELEQWDPDYIRRTLPLLKTLFAGYFRGEVRGLENIPADGPALLVGNHSGGLMIADTFVFSFAFYERFGHERRFHQLAHDLVTRFPGLGTLRKYGTVGASHENARGAFERRAPVLVYPGGDHETFRPSWHSDRIEFAGRKGFVRLALTENVPIIPVVSIGGQETALFLTRGEGLARLLRLDRLLRLKVVPLALGPPTGISLLDLPTRLPLPAKVTIRVMPPIDLRERFGPEPEADLVYDEVTGEMQEMLSSLADERTLPVGG